MSRALPLPRLSSSHQTADELEWLLGDPMDDDRAGAFGYRAIVHAEERDSLPDGAVETLRAWGFHRFLAPTPLGGRLNDLEELFCLVRVLARRNLTVAVMFGSSMLAVNPVWLWGDELQQRRVAAGILGGELACFGVSEADHGSDLKANEARADPDGEGFTLTGAKWPVGNATRGRFVTAQARTGNDEFSLLLVDKPTLDPRHWSTMPPVKTLGLRGHDLSGIEFSGARLPGDAVIGHRGMGLVQTLKALQITRTAIAALSLGTMDAVVRIGRDHARQRRLYGGPAAHIPVVRDHLVKAHLDVWIAECLAHPVARSLTLAPGRLSLWSSVAKYLVPVLGENVVAHIGNVLAARGYLREGVAHGVFQKLQRDHAIASIFEGTTHVNLATIADQLPHVVAESDRRSPPADDLLARLHSWTAATPAWRPDGKTLRLTNDGRDEYTSQYDTVVGQTLDTARKHVDDDVYADLEALTVRVTGVRARLHRRIRDAVDDTTSTAAFHRAEQHCLLMAMTSCMLTWIHNRDAFGGAFATGEWLVLCLTRLLQRIDPDTQLPEERLATVESAMETATEHNAWFSLRLLTHPAARSGMQ